MKISDWLKVGQVSTPGSVSDDQRFWSCGCPSETAGKVRFTKRESGREEMPGVTSPIPIPILLCDFCSPSSLPLICPTGFRFHPWLNLHHIQDLFQMDWGSVH